MEKRMSGITKLKKVLTFVRNNTVDAEHGYSSRFLNVKWHSGEQVSGYNRVERQITVRWVMEKRMSGVKKVMEILSFARQGWVDAEQNRTHRYWLIDEYSDNQPRE